MDFGPGLALSWFDSYLYNMHIVNRQTLDLPRTPIYRVCFLSPNPAGKSGFYWTTAILYFYEKDLNITSSHTKEIGNKLEVLALPNVRCLMYTLCRCFKYMSRDKSYLKMCNTNCTNTI